MLSRGGHPAWAKRQHERFDLRTRWLIVKARRTDARVWGASFWRDWWDDLIYLVCG